MRSSSTSADVVAVGAVAVAAAVVAAAVIAATVAAMAVSAVVVADEVAATPVVYVGVVAVAAAVAVAVAVVVVVAVAALETKRDGGKRNEKRGMLKSRSRPSFPDFESFRCVRTRRLESFQILRTDFFSFASNIRFSWHRNFSASRMTSKVRRPKLCCIISVLSNLISFCKSSTYNESFVLRFGFSLAFFVI